MRRTLIQVAKVLFLFFVGILGLEILLHAFIKPSYSGYGLLFGHDLPPLKVILKSSIDPELNNQVWHQRGKPNPLSLTKGDLWGFLRQDKTLGYTTLENTRSLKDWWQSNNIGARSRIATLPKIAKGKKRVLIFGASYALGSRVSQEQTYFHLMQERHPELEIVNLSVDGYSMGQSLLRYQGIAKKLEFDVVLFVFAPDNNIWREVNTLRYLAEGWDAFIILPRFLLRGDQLVLVPGPYETGADVYKYNIPNTTDLVRNHLRKYDPFYLPMLYENPPIVGNLITEKIIAKSIGIKEKERIYEDTRSNLHSEGMDISRGIFKSVDVSVRKKGKKFALALLPDSEILYEIRENPGSARVGIWNERAQLLKDDRMPVVDLLPAMRALPEAEMDRGYDQSHYGAKTNRALARMLEEDLKQLGILN